MRHPTALRVASQRLLSPLALTVALIAAVVLSLVPNAVAHAASPTKSAHHTRGIGGPPKAVIIVGPVESLTSMYLTYGEQWADRAEAQGMDVRRVFSPNATWTNVLDNIQNARLVVFLGHGNGWPSPYGPFQEDTKDGFGLNASAAGSHNNVKYYGANSIRASVHLGNRAIVVLGHACYSAGTGEPWQADPTETVARQRVDNFAAGFLAAGASTYFSYYYEQTRDMVSDLFTKHATMDQLFMLPGTNSYGGYRGVYAPYHDSSRTPGARVHMDKIPDYGWYRSVAGDLEMTTDDWLGQPGEPDDTAPILSDFSPQASSYTFETVATGSAAPVVFTPNGDGVSDTVGVATTTSEGAYVDVVVKNAADNHTVRKFTSWVPEGSGKVTWDGKTATGGAVADGTYKLSATPKDRAGNVGDPAYADVNLLTTLKSPVVTPSLFYGRDGDTLAATSKLTISLVKRARVSWKLVDKSGAVIATHLEQVDAQPGTMSWTWDGRTDEGSWAADGVFWSVVTATTDAGRYSHRFGVTQGAFKLYTTTTSVSGGVRVTYTITTAEPLSKSPSVTITQPGVTAWKVSTSKMDSTRYRAYVTFKTGHPGVSTIRVYGYDSNNAGQSTTFNVTVN